MVNKMGWATPELYLISSGNEATQGAGGSKNAAGTEGTTGGCASLLDQSNCPKGKIIVVEPPLQGAS